MWQREILPSRVEDFDPSWLHELIEDGTLVFGRFCVKGLLPGGVGGGGTVLCQPASLAHLFVWNDPRDYPLDWPELLEQYQHCLEIYDHIVKSGGATLAEVVSATGLPPSVVELWVENIKRRLPAAKRGLGK